MIKIEDIYAATNKGLDIIMYYYPQATKGKKFAVRTEGDASTSIKLINDVWKLTDFGDNDKSLSPIDICMKKENCTFYEAVLKLGDRYNVGNSLNPAINKCDIKQENAPDDVPEGNYEYELNDCFSASELQFLGPGVTEELCTKWKYYSVKWYSTTKNRKTTTFSSNEHYPIFMRICNGFMKVYKPLELKRDFRFRFLGNKPQDYINGLDELKAAFQKKEGEKIEQVIICSGERDALNTASFGYFPLWLNSESAPLNEWQYKEIERMTNRIYNIPDIDSTGIKKGVELSLKYLDIYTVTLPSWLSDYKDHRGKPRKDLRDYVELRPTHYDFRTLLETACPCKFWEYVKDEKKTRLTVNTLFLLHFLKQNGFGKIIHPETKESIFIRVNGYIVEQISPKQIRSFIVKDLKERHFDNEILNLVLNSSRTNANIMEDLDEFQLNFKAHSINGQYLFFANKALYVTAGEIKELQGKSSGVSVWDKNVNPHDFKRIAPSITLNEDLSIKIEHTKSHFFRYLINASRMFWREEFEYRAEPEQAANEKYRSDHKFDIAGARLNAAEIDEQQRHLYNKIYALGYLMHRYKTPDLALAVWAMENKLTASDESSGGSGKSFMFNFLKNFKRTITLNGRNRKLLDDRFFMDRVDQFTDLVNVDDVHRTLPLDPFYAGITGDMPVPRKNITTLEIKHEDAPKICFSSNFPPQSTDPSTLRRLLIVVFSDYYHKQTAENDYLETRKISDDFGYTLYNEQYKEDFWNEDFNFIVDCMQFYLTLSAKNIILEAPMENVNKRININTMGEDFQEWASAYFSEEGYNVDAYIERTTAFDDFRQANKAVNWTMRKFVRALKAFCENEDYIECLNPPEIADKRGRVIKRVGSRTPDFIYIKTKDTPIKEYTGC